MNTDGPGWDRLRTYKVEMSIHQSPTAEPDPAIESGGNPEPAFASSAGLRVLLDRLHDAGPDAWRNDPDANALLAYTIDRYAPLARTWHRDPGEAATAAFLAMRHDGVRRAADPWAVVTRAVQVSLSAENHADRHLTSVEKARRSQHAGADAPLRAGDYTDTLTTHTSEPASTAMAWGTQPADQDDTKPVLADATTLLRLLGWPEPVAATVVEYVAARLADAGSIPAAYETLRRDTAIRVQLDLDRTVWTTLVGVLLGGRPQPGRPTRKGVLARLLLGDTIRDLLDDTALVRVVIAAVPHRGIAAAPIRGETDA